MQFLVVGEFVSVARAHQHVEVVPRHPIVEVLSNDADVRNDTCNGRHEQMVREAGIQDEDAFCPGPNRDCLAHSQFVQEWRQVSVRRRDEFYEKLKIVFIGRGHDGVGSFDSIDAYRAVLAWLELKSLRLLDPHLPQVVCDVFARGDRRSS